MSEHIDELTLNDFLHRELSPERDASVHAHLAACPHCTRSYDAEARLSERLREEARASELEFPAGIAARVRAAAERETRSAWIDSIARLFRPAVGLPTAAVIVLALVLGVSSLRPHGAPTIAASYYIDDHAALSTSSLPFSQTAAVPATLEANANGQGLKETAATAILKRVIAAE